jgi:hypothetical protein
LDTRPPSADGERGLRAGAWVVLAAAAAYTLVRAWRLKTDYYDAFVYLYNACRFLGEPIGPALEDRRPWLLSVLQAPVVALARHGGPGNVWLLRGPHLINAALSLGAVAACLALLRRHFGKTLALLGAALFVAGRGFLHYSANTMTDLGVTGLCALTVHLHLDAARTRRLGRFALAGVVFGLAAAFKFTAPLLVGALLATEAAALIEVTPAAEGRRRLRLRVDPRRHLGLVVEGLVTVATFVVVELGALWRFYGAGAWAAMRAASGSLFTLYAGLVGERWTDNFPLLVGIVSVPVAVLAIAGALAAVARPRRSDATFVAWLAGMGGGLFFAVAHNEARYLLPLAPAVIYFALRGVEAALAVAGRAGRGGARAAAAGIALLVVWSLATGVAQAGADRDPLLTRDVHGRAARALAARRPGSIPYSVGVWVTLAPETPGPLPEDEFWNTFHASPFVASYELGEATQPLPGVGPPAALRDVLHWRLADGARALRFAGSYFETREFPKGPRHQALEVWTVRRHDLELVSVSEVGGRIFGERRPTGGAPVGATLNVVDLEAGKPRPSLVGVPAGGPWWVYTKTPKRTWAFAGSTDTPDLALADAADVDGLDLVRVDVERIE